jgi:hypothetical protein
MNHKKIGDTISLIITNIDYDKVDAHEGMMDDLYGISLYDLQQELANIYPLTESFIDSVIDDNKVEMFPYISGNPSLTEAHIRRLAKKGYFVIDVHNSPVDIIHQQAILWCEGKDANTPMIGRIEDSKLIERIYRICEQKYPDFPYHNFFSKNTPEWIIKSIISNQKDKDGNYKVYFDFATRYIQDRGDNLSDELRELYLKTYSKNLEHRDGVIKALQILASDDTFYVRSSIANNPGL